MGGFTLNAYNSFALEAFDKEDSLRLHSAVVSTELELEKINSLKGKLPRGIVAYGRLPLMLTRNCPIKNGTDCKSCKQSRRLTDRKGIKFPVMCNNGCSEIFNSRPIYMADHLDEIKNTDFLFLYFSVEDKEKVSGVIKAYENELEPKMEFTRGLYYRGAE